MTVIESDGKTHTGKVRDHNEDTIFVSDEQCLWIVADGMGGHACGEVASDITVGVIKRSVAENIDLGESIINAHVEVITAAENNPEANGMGTTVVSMKSTDSRFEISWVGDSRAYLLRGHDLHLLTRDHSYLEWLKDNGVTVDEARNHPKRNIITQSIGVGDPSPDTITGKFEPGDRFLLCSDGLNDELTDEQIGKLLLSAAKADVVTQQLIDAALEEGGRDNVSVIVVDVEPSQRTVEPRVVSGVVGGIKAAVTKLLS
jgi:protein phosphatase